MHQTEMSSLKRKVGFTRKRVPRTEWAQKTTGSVADGALKKRTLEKTKEDFDTSMLAKKSLKIKLVLPKKIESCGDDKSLLNIESAQKPVGSVVGGVSKKRKLERTQEEEKGSPETPLKTREFPVDHAQKVLSHHAEKPMGAIVGFSKKRRLERTKEEEEKGNPDNPLKTTEFHGDAKRVLSDCAQKPMGSVGGVLKKRGSESTLQEEEKSKDKTPLKTTTDELYAEAKRILSSDWKKLTKRERQREATRLELAQIKNTAGFGADMEALIEFEKICGCSLSYPTCTRDSCYGSSYYDDEGF